MLLKKSKTGEVAALKESIDEHWEIMQSEKMVEEERQRQTWEDTSFNSSVGGDRQPEEELWEMAVVGNANGPGGGQAAGTLEEGRPLPPAVASSDAVSADLNNLNDGAVKNGMKSGLWAGSTHANEVLADEQSGPVILENHQR